MHYLKSVGLTQTLGIEDEQNIINPLMVLDQNFPNSYTVIHIRAQEIDSSQILWLETAQLLGLPPQTPLFLTHLTYPIICTYFNTFLDDGAIQFELKQGWGLK